jgi:hypothetical protein
LRIELAKELGKIGIQNQKLHRRPAYLKFWQAACRVEALEI